MCGWIRRANQRHSVGLRNLKAPPKVKLKIVIELVKLRGEFKGTKGEVGRN